MSLLRVMLISLFALAASFVLQGDSYAQLQQPLLKQNSDIPEPSQEIAPLPDVPQAPKPEVKSLIPPLPVSAPCKQPDIEGLWKLMHVYEDPAGAETTNYAQTSEQFMLFRPNGIYGRYNDSRALLAPKFIIEQINKYSSTLLQYLVQDKGIVYFYQDKVANDLQACFIVTKTDSLFKEGDMLMMPPKGQIQGRLVKHFTKIWSRQKPVSKQNYKQVEPPNFYQPSLNGNSFDRPPANAKTQ